MSFIVVGRQENPLVHSADRQDDVFAFDLDQEATVAMMVEPIMDAQGVMNAAFTFYVFENGVRLSPEDTTALVAEATVKAKELYLEREKQYQAEREEQSKRATARQEAIDRKHYEAMKLRFEGKS